MRRFATVLVAAGVMIGAAAVPASGVDAPPVASKWFGTGKLVPLKSLGGGESWSERSNERGDLIGSSLDPAGDWQAVVWWQGRRSPARLHVKKSSPRAISDNRYITGRVHRKGGGVFLWRKGKVSYLWDRAGMEFEATAVNNRGQVVGTAYYGQGKTRAFLWHRGRLTWLPVAGKTNGAAVGLNNRGQVVGVATPRGTGNGKAVLWQRGRVVKLGTLGGRFSAPVAINDRGQIAGNSAIKGSPTEHPFLWQRGRMTDLLAGSHARYGRVNALSDTGTMAGYATWADGDNVPVLWKKGRMRTVGVPGHVGIGMVVNDRGDVAGMTWAQSGSLGMPFRWRHGRITLFPKPVADISVRVVGIDRSGTVAMAQETTRYGLRVLRSA